MKKFSIVIDCFKLSYDELKNYLLSLDGVNEVDVVDIDDLLRLNVLYDINKITDNIIKLEILAFLDLLDYSVIYEFDRHFDGETKTYEKEINSICCEFCYSSCIEDLFEMDGVVKVTSNFYLKHFKRKYVNEKYKIIVTYDSKKGNLSQIEKIINDLEE